jgi:hypothetical protein
MPVFLVFFIIKDPFGYFFHVIITCWAAFKNDLFLSWVPDLSFSQPDHAFSESLLEGQWLYAVGLEV